MWGDFCALKDATTSRSYRQLEDRTNRLANVLLELGLKKGDRAATLSWNRCELAECEVTFYKAGLARVPINARLSEDESLHVINDSGASVLIADPEHRPAAERALEECPSLKAVLLMGEEATTSNPLFSLEERLAQASSDPIALDMELDDVAVLHYTSGSSGVLKAAMQTVGCRQAALRKLIFRCNLRPASDAHQEKMIHVGPITHVSGMTIMPLLCLGHCNIIKPRFDAEDFLKTVEDERATHTYLVPTMINRILAQQNKESFDISSLKLVRYGAAPISPARLKQAVQFFGPILNQGYGAGEVSSSVTVLTEEDHAEAANGKEELFSSCGRPLFDTEVKVVDDNGVEMPIGERGEIVVRGSDVMKGYWNAPDLTAPVLINGYYHTGDIAYVDERGYLFIVDRKKDMIVTGGFNVYPNEVEKALFAHPAVYEACVVGVPDKDLGEAIKAVVVLNDQESTDAEQLITHCADQLGKFKKPHSIDFVSDLPKNNSGKIQRRDVRSRYWADGERQI
jgi:acyl-CoA synthetase (AMP-forming)/AMP-acid ligase II